MAKVGTEYVMKTILTTRQTEPLILPKGEYKVGLDGDANQDLPSWLSEKDLAYYVSKFEKTGFTGGLHYYRNINLYVSHHHPLHFYFPKLEIINGLGYGFIIVLVVCVAEIGS